MHPIPFTDNSYQFQNKYFLNEKIIKEIDPFFQLKQNFKNYQWLVKEEVVIASRYWNLKKF